MLHSLPSLLTELERRLMAAEDPLPLLGSVRWAELRDWPDNKKDALLLRQRLINLQMLISGLEAPIRATLMGLNQEGAYQRQGGIPLPDSITFKFQQSV